MTKIFSRCPKNIGNDEVSLFVKAGKELVEKHFSTVVNKMSDNSVTSKVKSLFSDLSVDSYAKDNEDFLNTLMKYCFDKANTGLVWNGLETIKNPMVRNTAFKETFNAVIAQILTPVIYAVVSTQYMELAEIQNIAYGDTGRFIIKPNEVFLVHEIAQGIQLGGLQRLYNDEVTVNPTPKQIFYNMEWYQVAAGVFDFGDWSYKIGASYSAYIQSQVVAAFQAIVTAGIAGGSSYFASGFTDAQYLQVGQRVKAGNANSQVYVFGTLASLGKVIPTTAGLQYGLGEEWAKVGYLDRYKGFRLMEMEQAIVPGTVNTSPIFMIPDNVLYFIPMNMYKPVKVVFEGSNVVVETVPTQTVDKTGGLSITCMIGITTAVGSKFGALTNV